MRTAEEQMKINEYNLIAQVKHLKTSIMYFEEMIKKGKFDYQSVQHLQDECITVMLGADKYMLLQLMRDTDTPPWPDPNVEYKHH